jgi:hypothetical protein
MKKSTKLINFDNNAYTFACTPDNLKIEKRLSGEYMSEL